ncbi:MAG: DNA-binding response regulator [Acidobacteria bacterium]|nr:MAG: DNA-binding response regulator [Acidobacteriota bacterium]
MSDTIRVLLVDDHAILRAGLSLLIRSQPGMEVVGEAEDAATAVRLAGDLKPDIVVLDISMPGESGLEAIGKLIDAAPGCRVLVLTMHDDYAYLRAAMAAGTSGYVVKSAADEELIEAIRRLHQGRTFISVSLDHDSEVEAASTPVQGGERHLVPELSPREAEALEYVAYGYTSQQIADRLGLSVKTVDGYRARLSEKLGLRSRAELVRYALEKGILDRHRPPPGSEPKEEI